MRVPYMFFWMWDLRHIRDVTVRDFNEKRRRYLGLKVCMECLAF